MKRITLFILAIAILSACTKPKTTDGNNATPVVIDSPKFTGEYMLFDSVYSYGTTTWPPSRYSTHDTIHRQITVTVDSLKKQLTYDERTFECRDTTPIYYYTYVPADKITLTTDSIIIADWEQEFNHASSTRTVRGYRIK